MIRRKSQKTVAQQLGFKRNGDNDLAEGFV